MQTLLLCRGSFLALLSPPSALSSTLGFDLVLRIPRPVEVNPPSHRPMVVHFLLLKFNVVMPNTIPQQLNVLRLNAVPQQAAVLDCSICSSSIICHKDS